MGALALLGLRLLLLLLLLRGLHVYQLCVVVGKRLGVERIQHTLFTKCQSFLKPFKGEYYRGKIVFS